MILFGYVNQVRARFLLSDPLGGLTQWGVNPSRAEPLTFTPSVPVDGIGRRRVWEILARVR